MIPVEVPQGRLKSPFYDRMKAVDTVNSWHEWKGYTTPDELYCGETEYFALRNSTGVFDLTPMTKYRITGPDALRLPQPPRNARHGQGRAGSRRLCGLV